MNTNKILIVILSGLILNMANSQDIVGMKPIKKQEFKIYFIKILDRGEFRTDGNKIKTCDNKICLSLTDSGPDISSIDCNISNLEEKPVLNLYNLGSMTFENKGTCSLIENYLDSLNNSEIDESNPVVFTFDWSNRKITKVKFPDVGRHVPWALNVEDSGLNVVPDKTHAGEQESNSSNNTTQV